METLKPFSCMQGLNSHTHNSHLQRTSELRQYTTCREGKYLTYNGRMNDELERIWKWSWPNRSTRQFYVSTVIRGAHTFSEKNNTSTRLLIRYRIIILRIFYNKNNKFYFLRKFLVVSSQSYQQQAYKNTQQQIIVYHHNAAILQEQNVRL